VNIDQIGACEIRNSSAKRQWVTLTPPSRSYIHKSRPLWFYASGGCTRVGGGWHKCVKMMKQNMPMEMLFCRSVWLLWRYTQWCWDDKVRPITILVDKRSAKVLCWRTVKMVGVGRGIIPANKWNWWDEWLEWMPTEAKWIAPRLYGVSHHGSLKYGEMPLILLVCSKTTVFGMYDVE